MKYKIKIYYTTGDSYKSYKREEVLELSWENLDIAKENLKAIKDHYDGAKSFPEYSFEKWIELNKGKFWFVVNKKLYSISRNQAIDERQKDRFVGDCEYRIDEYVAKSCIKFKTDDGNLMQIGCFWIGCFESIDRAEIIQDTEGMVIEF